MSKNVLGQADHGVSQPSWRPTAKVLAGWVTGAGATTVLGVLAALTDAVSVETFWGSLGAAVLAGGASWLQKNRVTDR